MMLVSEKVDIRDNTERRATKKSAVVVYSSNQETKINEIGDLILVYFYCNIGKPFA